MAGAAGCWYQDTLSIVLQYMDPYDVHFSAPAVCRYFASVCLELEQLGYWEDLCLSSFPILYDLPIGSDFEWKYYYLHKSGAVARRRMFLLEQQQESSIFQRLQLQFYQNQVRMMQRGFEGEDSKLPFVKSTHASMAECKVKSSSSITFVLRDYFIRQDGSPIMFALLLDLEGTFTENEQHKMNINH